MSRVAISLLVGLTCLFATGCARWTAYAVSTEYDDELLISTLSDRRQYSTELGMSHSSPSGAAGEALIRKGTNSVMAVIGALQNSNDPWVRRTCAYILGQIRDTRAVEPLIAALKDPVGDVRSTAADALETLRDPRAIAPLIAALKDGDVPVRIQAAIALRKFPSDPRIVEPMIALLDEKYVQYAAIGTLGEIHDSRVLPAIRQAFKGLDHGAKEKAIDVFMMHRQEPQVFDLISLAAEDDSYWVRLSATRAFGYWVILDPRVVEPLTRLSKDPNKPIRDAALEVLNRREKLLSEKTPTRQPN
jgi:HEAT repeat protein